VAALVEKAPQGKSPRIVLEKFRLRLRIGERELVESVRLTGAFLLAKDGDSGLQSWKASNAIRQCLQ